MFGENYNTTVHFCSSEEYDGTKVNSFVSHIFIHTYKKILCIFLHRGDSLNMCFWLITIEYRIKLKVTAFMGESNKFMHSWVKFKISSLMWWKKKTHLKRYLHFWQFAVLFVLFGVFLLSFSYSKGAKSSIALQCLFPNSHDNTVMMVRRMMRMMVQVQAIPVSHPRLYTDCTLSGYFGSRWVMASVVSANIIGCWSCPSGKCSAHHKV